MLAHKDQGDGLEEIDIQEVLRHSCSRCNCKGSRTLSAGGNRRWRFWDSDAITRRSQLITSAVQEGLQTTYVFQVLEFNHFVDICLILSMRWLLWHHTRRCIRTYRSRQINHSLPLHYWVFCLPFAIHSLLLSVRQHLSRDTDVIPVTTNPNVSMFINYW